MHAEIPDPKVLNIVKRARVTPQISERRKEKGVLWGMARKNLKDNMVLMRGKVKLLETSRIYL